MAYITKSEVQEKRKLISALCKEYGITATVSGSNSYKLTVTIRKGRIDFLGNYADTVKTTHSPSDRYNQIADFRLLHGWMEIDPYNLNRDFKGESLEFISDLLSILKIGYSQYPELASDFPWFISVFLGEPNKPYILAA